MHRTISRDGETGALWRRRFARSDAVRGCRLTSALVGAILMRESDYYRELPRAALGDIGQVCLELHGVRPDPLFWND